MLPPPSTLGSKRRSKSLGFTILEMAISLVIIGLIAGGIMTGLSLVETSKIHAQIKQKEEIIAGATTFKLRNGYLPGDIPPSQAAQLGLFTFTGSAIFVGKPYYIESDPEYGSKIYGFGDGNGRIDEGERYIFWQHLSEAKLINGQYGGSASGTYLRSNISSYSNAGDPVNPISPTYPDGWDVFLPQSKLSHRDRHIYVYANHIYTSKPFFTNTSLPNLFRFYATPYQMFAIDSKIDDGLPDSGTVRNYGTYLNGAYKNYFPNSSIPCVTATIPNAYDLTSSTANNKDTCYLAILW